MVVDDLFSVIHATVTDLNCVKIKYFSESVVFREVLSLLGQGICVRYWC